MRQVSFSELEALASAARESIWAQAENYGREPKIYLHWTAGHYGQPSDHYHICIDKNGEIYLMHEDLGTVVQGTWKRNSGSVNITLCGCYQSGSRGLGPEPPTGPQIETMARLIDIVGDALWLTIDKKHVMTHGEAANNEDGLHPHLPYAWWNDGYGDGDTRGDLEYLGTSESPRYNPSATDGSRGGDVLRGKANWYRNKRKGKDI